MNAPLKPKLVKISRQQAHIDKKLKDGQFRLMVWFRPEDAAALGQLRAAYGSRQKGVRQAVLATAKRISD